jgi:hypothetical protein
MTHLAAKSDTIGSLTLQHQHISDLLNKHQLLLMHGEIQGADELYAEFKTYISKHLRAENEHLLPLYEKYISPFPIGGAPELFIHEHHQINRYLEKFSGKFFSVKKNNRHIHLDIVKLFEEYYIFKQLLGHHHLREDTFLFRLLDEVLDDKLKKEVLSYFFFHPNRAMGF